MGGWTIAVHILFPIPFIFLVLLSLPLPGRWASSLRKAIIKIIDITLFTKLFNKVNLYQFCIIISSILFLISAFETAKMNKKKMNAKDTLLEEKVNCLKWRSERNFWISLFSTVLWLVLSKVYKLTKDLQLLKDQNQNANQNANANNGRPHQD